MNHLRPASLLFIGGLFMALGAPSCAGSSDDPPAEKCSPGTKGCECKTSDKCNTGLDCADGKCVASTEQGGSGGAATGGGASGRANGGRAGTEAFARGGTGHPMGGTSAEAGAGGEPSTGGALGRGTGGTGNVTGQSGEGAAAGEAGSPGSGGSGGSSTGGTGGTGGSGGTGGTGGSGGSPACIAITLTDVVQALSDNTANYASVYTPNQRNIDDDVVALQIYDGFIEELSYTYHGADLGTFQLGMGDDANYRTCSRCLVGAIDEPYKWFFATAGTLTFTAGSDQMNGSPLGTLRNVVLREATYTTDTFDSTLVPGGQCLTIANADALVNGTPPPPPPPPSPNWTCDYDFYDDGDFCDCGCGDPDPDCGGVLSSSVCEYCYCNSADDQDCSAVSTTQNHVCL